MQDRNLIQQTADYLRDLSDDQTDELGIVLTRAAVYLNEYAKETAVSVALPLESWQTLIKLLNLYRYDMGAEFDYPEETAELDGIATAINSTLLQYL